MPLCTKRGAILLPCFLVLICLSSWTYAASSLQKERVSRSVYIDIAQSIRDFRQAPAFNFIPAGEFMSDNAFFNPENTTINLGEKIYDICAGFGKDSLNALALVLGHELAHFYKDHQWGLAFGTAHFQSGIGEEILNLSLSPERKREMEAEADYFGAFYGYVAGYNPLDIGPVFYDSLYKALDIPDDTEGYPDRADRVRIANGVQEELKDLARTFDAANYLMLVEQYESAGRCLALVQRKFPSPEVMNNAGLCYARAALGTFQEDELKFVYPFGLDAEAHLPKYTPRGSQNNFAERKRLLAAAYEMLAEAIRANPSHAQAHLNLALVELLRGESLMAQAHADKALKLATAQEKNFLAANACIALGIVAAENGATEVARGHFEVAGAHSPLLASWNLELLENAGKDRPKSIGEGEILSVLEETMGKGKAEPGLAEILMYDAKRLEVKGEREGQGDLELRVATGEDWQGVSVKRFSFPMTRSTFLATPPDYSLSTARGIRLGDDRQIVESLYGSPSQISLDGRYTYCRYPQTKIIFAYDQEQSLRRWILYSIR